MQGSWGRLNALVQVKDFHKIPKGAQANFLRNLSLDHGGSRVYVYVGKGDWYRTMGEAVKVFTDINDADGGGGVMSVMVDGYTRGWLNQATGFQERMWSPEYPAERSGAALDAEPEQGKLIGAHDYTKNPHWFGKNHLAEQALLRLHSEREAFRDPGAYSTASQRFSQRVLSDYDAKLIDPQDMHIDLLDLLIPVLHNAGRRDESQQMQALFDKRKSEDMGRIRGDLDNQKRGRGQPFREPLAGDVGPGGERERAKPQTDFDHTQQRTPYTYGDAEAFSTHLRRKIEALERSGTSNPQEVRWYKKLRNALEADMDESLRAHRPDLADKIDAVDLAYAQGMHKVNSSYASTS